MTRFKLQAVIAMFKEAFNTPAILYISFLSFGIMLCFSLQLSNYSTLFKFYGTSPANLPWLWIIPPLSGFIMQPLVGQLSDDTATRFGKRKPYIFGWGLLSIIATCLLSLPLTFPVVLGLIWLLNCSLNSSTEILRALTADVIKDDNRSKAFSLQALFAGLGGAIGASLPVILHNIAFIKHMPNVGPIPFNLKFSFQIAALVLTLSMCCCLLLIKEKIIKQSFLSKPKRQSIGSFISKTSRDLWKNICRMSTDLRVVCYIHALGWVGIFIFWLYFSTTIGQNIYHIPPNPHHLSSINALREKAALDSSYYFSVYQYVSIVYTFGLYLLPKRAPLQMIHAFSLLLGGLGLVCLGFERESYQVMLSMIGFGIMWGSMMTLPYTIAIRLLPKGKTGVYLGIFNICITLPQIICSLLLTLIYRYVFHQHAGLLVSMGGFIILVCAYFWLKNDKLYQHNHSFSLKMLKKTNVKAEIEIEG